MQTPEFTSIPVLIAKYGNMSACVRATGLNELTVSKYRFDTNCERHIIVNNRLMTNDKRSKDLYTRVGVTSTDRANGRNLEARA